MDSEADGPAGGHPVAVRLWERPGGLILLVAASAVVLAACGSPTATASSAPAVPAGGTGRSGPVHSATPEVSGTVAALSVAGATMELQSTSSQTTVDWTTSTAFSQTKAVSLAAVAAGACVTASGTPGAGTSGTSPSTVDAAVVRISAPPVGGSCTSRHEGTSGSGGPTGRFHRRHSRRTSAVAGSPAAGSTAPRRLTAAVGTVTAVSGTTITVEGFSRSMTVNPGARTGVDGSSKAAFHRSGSSFSTPSATTVTIDTASSTTFSETAPATDSVLADGSCATAIGPSSTNGTVTAKSIAVRPAGPHGCDTAVARFAGRGFAAAGSATGAS